MQQALQRDGAFQFVVCVLLGSDVQSIIETCALGKHLKHLVHALLFSVLEQWIPSSRYLQCWKKCLSGKTNIDFHVSLSEINAFVSVYMPLESLIYPDDCIQPE